MIVAFEGAPGRSEARGAMAGGFGDVDRANPLFERVVPTRVHAADRDEDLMPLTLRVLSGHQVRLFFRSFTAASAPRAVQTGEGMGGDGVKYH